MSPSIFDMFGGEGLEGEGGDAPFDPSNLDAILDKAIHERPVAGRPAGFDPDAGSPPLAPSSDGEAAGAEGGGSPAEAPVPPEAPPSPPPAAETPAPDFFTNLNDLERQELMAVRQALADPERAQAVKRAYLGVEQPAVAASPPEPAPPAPTLPEHIDPGSFEAELWQQNQAMQRELAEIRGGLQQQTQLTEQQIVGQAAQAATQRFVGRYGSQLSKEEIEAVCSTAGMQRLPEAFRPTVNTWDEAMDKALEFTMRSNDTLLAKVLGTPPAAPPPAPGERTPEAVHRGRVLTALSSAASPSGDVPQRTPLEHRGDGKLTEKSRLSLVQEMMNSLEGTGEGIR